MSMYDPHYSRRQRPLEQDPSVYSHSRTRTTSSNVMPNPPQFQQSALPMHLAQPPQGHQRRTPSVNTFSTISSSGMVPPAAYRTSPTTNADIRRSTSSRSAGGGSIAPSSYVTLLRKQKATVWCDRAQYEDPRMIAQHRAAKMRANKEVVGATGGGGASSGTRTSTGFSSNKVAAKIKHHGRPTVVDYSPENNYVGVGGVPLRLSATEVDGAGESEEEDAATQRLHHRRTGSSGRSSTNSGRRQLGYRTSGGLAPTGSSGSNHNRRYSPGDTPERTGSLVQQDHIDTRTSSIQDDAASGRAPTTGSGSSAERRDDVPDLGTAQRQAPNSAAHATVSREKSVKTADDLRRRGSVDERTMTLTAGRLFIANPD